MSKKLKNLNLRQKKLRFKSGKGEIHNEEKPYIEKLAKDGAYDFKPEKTPFAAFIKSDLI